MPGIRPSEARILHDAHLRSPDQLAAADEEQVAEQLAKGLQRTMQDRRQATAMIAPRGFSVGKAMAKRHAKRIVSGRALHASLPWSLLASLLLIHTMPEAPSSI